MTNLPAAAATPVHGAPIPQLMFLGLCPLLAKGTTLLTAACLGAAAAVVLCGSAWCLLACRRLVPASAPVVFILLLTAAWVSVIDLALQYWLFPLRQALGIYVPLIAANVLVLSTLEERMLAEGTVTAFGRACAMGVWVFACAAVAGGLRELVTSGVLLGDLSLLGSGQDAASPAVFALIKAPAGAFLTLAALAALLQTVLLRRTRA